MLSVRPPEYWPRPLFFALADAVDSLVLADTFQYSRQSYQNRARLRNPQGSQWISVPLRGRQHGLPITEVAIRGRPHWMRTHWRAVEFNYRTAPYFAHYEHDVRWIFERNWARLGDLACATVEVLSDLLGLRTPVLRASMMAGRPDSVEAIVRAAGSPLLLASKETARYEKQFVSPVRVLEFRPLIYRQNFEGFEPGMSVLDLLFNYGRDALPLLRSHAYVGSFVTA